MQPVTAFTRDHHSIILRSRKQNVFMQPTHTNLRKSTLCKVQNMQISSSLIVVLCFLEGCLHWRTWALTGKYESSKHMYLQIIGRLALLSAEVQSIKRHQEISFQ